MFLISGIIVATNGNVIEQRRQHGGHPQYDAAGDRHVVAGRRDQPLGKQLEQSADLDGMNHDEQSHEEKNRDPFDVGERLVDVLGLFGAS